MPITRSSRAITSISLLVLPAGAAAAQAAAVERGFASIAVADRPRPEFAPIGGRLGAFFLYPTIDAGAAFDGNVLGTDTDVRRDAVASLRVGATLESHWSRHALAADGYGRVIRYATLRSQDAEAFGGHGAGRYDVGRGFVSVDARLDVRPEDRLAVDAAVASLRPIRTRTADVQVRADQSFGAATLSVRGRRLDLSYGDGRTAAGIVIDQGFRDAVQHIGEATLRADLASGTALVLAGQYDALAYRADGGRDRDSTGYRIEAGIALRPGHLLAAEIRVGYLRRRNRDPAFPDAQGLSLYADALWTPSARLAFRLTANRDVEPTGGIATPGNLRTQAAGAVDYELRRGVIVTPSLRIARVDAIGLAGRNTEIEPRLLAAWHLSRRYRVTGEVRHFARSAGQYRPIGATVAGIGFGVTL